MARGWESKSIEDQQAESVRTAEELKRVPLTPEAIARQQRLETLCLARSQFHEQLKQARNETHRQMIISALQTLEEELARLSATM